MTTPSLILASASPRRQELLRQIGVGFAVQAQDIDETPRPGEHPETYVQRMAAEKAAAARSAFPDAVVLAADTTVVCAGQILGKPADEAEAVAMLTSLSGRDHQVLTAVAVGNGDATQQALSRSTVSFRNISASEAQRYWQTGEPRGKAGAYAIQGYAAVFVCALQGSFSGVMGLPLFETASLLAEFNIPVWRSGSDAGAEESS